MNPLLQAMSAPDVGNPNPRPQINPAQMVEVSCEGKIGDQVCIYGTIRAIQDGRAKVLVDHVEAPENEIVTTQESHTP